jgi:hypothetical protein
MPEHQQPEHVRAGNTGKTGDPDPLPPAGSLFSLLLLSPSRLNRGGTVRMPVLPVSPVPSPIAAGQLPFAGPLA